MGSGAKGFDYQAKGYGNWAHFVLSKDVTFKTSKVSTLGKWILCQGRAQGRETDKHPEAGPRASLYWSFCRLFPFQLTLAPRFLPNALISVDFAANYLTKIYGLTFGQKPNLRSEVRGMILGVGMNVCWVSWRVWGNLRQRRDRGRP